MVAPPTVIGLSVGIAALLLAALVAIWSIAHSLTTLRQNITTLQGRLDSIEHILRDNLGNR